MEICCKRGDTGPLVLVLQKLLGVKECNGTFDEETEFEVKAFQEGIDLEVTGIADSETWNELI